MSNIYYAKLNVNERIFDVYKNKVSINTLMADLYKRIRSDVKVAATNYTYHFADLSYGENEFVIYGRLAKVFDSREQNVYDEKDKTIISSDIKNSTDYIAFAFDVMQELIYFVPIQKFGRKEFVDVFTLLIEKSFKELGGVKIYLLPENEKFNEKFNKIESLRTFTAVLIPPNAGSDNAILRANMLKSQMLDANVKEVDITLKSDVRDPINKESKLVKIIKMFAEKGYGYLKATGRDSKNEEIKIDTENDEKLQKKIHIDDSLKNSSVAIYQRVKESEE